MITPKLRSTTTQDPSLDQMAINMATGLPPDPVQPIPAPTPMPTSPFGAPVKGAPIPGPSPSPTVPPGTFTPIRKTTGLDTASPSPIVPPGTFPIGAPAPGTVSPNQLPPGQQFSPYRVTTDNLNNLLGSESPYIQNARRRGLEQANSRGMLNSSIAAGASERAAIESAMPILNQIMGLTGQRENQANTSVENMRSRQFEADMFNRNFNAQLAMLPIASAADMWSGLMQLAASDPTVFTPTVLAGYQDFFQTGFNEYISRYLVPGGG